MINRQPYLNIIKSHKDEQLVKIITGIRHCGKSSIIDQYIDELKASGIDEEHIIHLNLENSVFSGLRTAKDIETFIAAKTKAAGKFYLFVDEVQSVGDWDKIVSALFSYHKLDIYLTSSCADLMSKKVQERKNKFIEIGLKTLSFAEYKKNCRVRWEKGSGLLNRAIAIKNATEAQFANYVFSGGFPSVFINDTAIQKARLNDIYSSILFRDVVQRFNIRNIELLERIIKYLFETIGKENSTQKTIDYLKKQRYKKNLSLVYTYIKALESAFIIKRVHRYNFVTGKILRTNIKFFIEDHALLNAVMEINDDIADGIYENILVNDLQGRSYIVFTGKLETETLDFLAARDKQIFLIQTVSKNIDDINVIDRKIDMLNRACEFCDGKEKQVSKYLIFFDPEAVWEEGSGDVIFITLPEFLLRCDS